MATIYDGLNGLRGHDIYQRLILGIRQNLIEQAEEEADKIFNEHDSLRVTLDKLETFGIRYFAEFKTQALEKCPVKNDMEQWVRDAIIEGQKYYFVGLTQFGKDIGIYKPEPSSGFGLSDQHKVIKT